MRGLCIRCLPSIYCDRATAFKDRIGDASEPGRGHVYVYSRGKRIRLGCCLSLGPQSNLFQKSLESRGMTLDSIVIVLV